MLAVISNVLADIPDDPSQGFLLPSASSFPSLRNSHQCQLEASTMSTSCLPQWPPVLSQDELHALTVQAATYALSHGLLYLPRSIPPTAPPTTTGSTSTTVAAPTSAVHAPVSLFPSPFPRSLFHLAQRLQRTYNVLYARIAMDEAFLDEIIGAVMTEDFVVRLWKIWKGLREGLVQVSLLDMSSTTFISQRKSPAPPAWSVPIRLSVARTERGRGELCLLETGRVQHGLLFLWSVVRAHRRNAQVSACSLDWYSNPFSIPVQ